MIKPITDEMKAMSEKHFNDLCEKQNRSIERAVRRGHTSCVCAIYTDHPLWERFKTEYERAGYIITPTGYIGGIWQLTYDMSW